MGRSVYGIKVLRNLLHRVLIRDDIAFADRQKLERIDAAAGVLSERYLRVPGSPAAMHYLVTELRALTLDARKALAKYGNG